jgi:hypothetical protein
MRFLADWIFGIVESYLLRGPAAAVVTKKERARIFSAWRTDGQATLHRNPT